MFSKTIAENKIAYAFQANADQPRAGHADFFLAKS